MSAKSFFFLANLWGTGFVVGCMLGARMSRKYGPAPDGTMWLLVWALMSLCIGAVITLD